MIKKKGKTKQKNGFLFFETSNKDGTNVEEAVLALISKVVELRKNQKKNPQSGEIDKNQEKGEKLEIKKTKKKNKKHCCQ